MCWEFAATVIGTDAIEHRSDLTAYTREPVAEVFRLLSLVVQRKIVLSTRFKIAHFFHFFLHLSREAGVPRESCILHG